MELGSRSSHVKGQQAELTEYKFSVLVDIAAKRVIGVRHRLNQMH
jgi:hypothetical protein